MIETKNDTTIIRPTPAKWYTGAAILLLLGLILPSVGWICLLFALTCAGLGSGKMGRLELSPQGIKTQNLWKIRTYAWNEVDDFKIATIRTGLFSSRKMLAFSRKDKKDTLYGKASTFFGGGTESVPIIGIKPDELMTSIGGYLARNTIFGDHIQQSHDFGKGGAPANPPKPQKTQGDIGFGRPNPARPAPPQAAPKPVFGRQSPSTPAKRATKPAPAPTPRVKPKSDPLVAEGGWMRKRRDSTGF